MPDPDGELVIRRNFFCTDRDAWKQSVFAYGGELEPALFCSLSWSTRLRLCGALQFCDVQFFHLQHCLNCFGVFEEIG
jgi:hypothetical protein